MVVWDLGGLRNSLILIIYNDSCDIVWWSEICVY